METFGSWRASQKNQSMLQNQSISRQLFPTAELDYSVVYLRRPSGAGSLHQQNEEITNILGDDD